jgi:uncharacterized protein (TIGR02186 family)
MRRSWLAPLAALALLPLGADAQQSASPIVVELAQPQVAIDIGFQGQDLLIFGLVEPGSDAIIVIRGDTRAETVRRKERILGVWTTGDERTFITVPSFYALATSRPIAQIFPDEFPLIRYELGPQNLNLTPLDLLPGDPETEKFRLALIDYKYSQGLYSDRPFAVTFPSAQLFRTTMYIPANVPIGRYIVRLYMIKNERVVAQRESHLIVDKVGVEEQIHRFAQSHGALYGLIAVALALLAGWLVTLLFRRSPA